MSQIRCVEIETTPAVRVSGRLLAEAILDSVEKPPGCPCGAPMERVTTKVEIVGSTVAVDLHLRCSSCG